MELLSRRSEAWRYVDVDLINAHPKQCSESIVDVEDLAKFVIDGAELLVLSGGRVDDARSNLNAWKGLFELEEKSSAKVLSTDLCAQRIASELHIKIAKGAPRELTLQVMVLSGGEGVESHSGVVIDIPSLTECSVVMSSVGQADSHWANQRWSFVVGAGAQVKAVSLHQNPSQAILTSSVDARCARDSQFHLQCLTSPSAMVRHHLQVDIDGENAEAHLSGGAVLGDGESVHHHLKLNHNAPHARSSQLFKVSLDGKSRASFDGMIEVAKGADGTDAQQLNRFLVLSDEARASGKPQLMIYADDVACAHGSTTGALEAEELFYLNSRGLATSTGEALLARGFIEEVLADCPVPEAASWYRQHHVVKRFQVEGK
jgi:Fe-S cluster assembly protein SufD